MGCASSKKSPRCRHCDNNPYSPMARSYSMHVHHPPQNKNDSYHVVALTSSTLGSLNGNRIEYEYKTNANGHDHIHVNKVCAEEEKETHNEKNEFSVGLIEAKTWSNMINQKIPKIIPKTPTQTPPGEPETINTWELMEGLEDISPLRSPNHHLRSFSFDVVRSPPLPASDVVVGLPKSRFHENVVDPPKPMWLQLAENEDLSSKVPQFDPDIISGFRKSFEEFKSEDPFRLSELDVQKKSPLENVDLCLSDEKEVDSVGSDYKCEEHCGKVEKDRVVLYFTSLRGVRKTYEDCCHVRVILKGTGVRVDERDVSMHSGFKEELKELVRDGFSGVSLPKVFVGNKYIGGANEIRQMHEDGKLEKLLDSCEKLDENGGGGSGGVCDACGDIRFVPCETCSGSCKIYYEDDEDHDEEEDHEEEAMEGECGFQRCPDCNENGLIRCPICCY